MKTEIVVASYKETLRWVDLWNCFNSVSQILPDCTVKIYRTGEQMDGATMIENRGREAGQWLYHIVENYDNLADATFFVQADLGASFGINGDEWPQDLNVFKRLRLPMTQGCCEIGPIDDFSFYIWPTLERVRCVVGEQGIAEEHIKGFGPGKPEQPSPEVSLIWGISPKTIKWPTGGAFLGAQHLVTRNFIRRLPRDYYSDVLDAVKKHELAHWLEFGKWPTIIYDIFRQGPLA